VAGDAVLAELAQQETRLAIASRLEAQRDGTAVFGEGAAQVAEAGFLGLAVVLEGGGVRRQRLEGVLQDLVVCRISEALVAHAEGQRDAQRGQDLRHGGPRLAALGLAGERGPRAGAVRAGRDQEQGEARPGDQEAGPRRGGRRRRAFGPKGRTRS
jgi:hypothetical protein